MRDQLLHLPLPDTFDLTTSATPQQVRTLFRRTVPIGIAHGTVAVLDRQGQPHEVTTFRRDVKTDGRHAVVEFGVSLEEDLARRDFTINAIAWQPLTAEWRDPFSGAADLDAKVIRAVGEPHLRFREDYLRILRALRFAARFGFTIEERTWAAAQGEAEGLKHLSAERVRDEWFKGLRTAREPAEFIALWEDVGAREIWLPEVRGERSAVSGLDTAPFRAPRTAHRSPDRALDPVLLTGYLSSDPEATLRRLKCSNAEIERARRIGAHRGAYPDPADAVAVRAWMATVGPAVDDLVAIATAEGKDGELGKAVKEVRAAGAPLAVGDLAITGNDLIELGVPQGPDIGRILNALLAHVLEHPEDNEPARLRERVQELRASAHRSPRTAHRGGEGEEGN